MTRDEFFMHAPRAFSEQELYERRREPRLNYNDQYGWYASTRVENLTKFYDTVAHGPMADHWAASHRLANDCTALLRLQYSAGDSIDSLRAFYPTAIWAWEEHVRHLDNWYQGEDFVRSFSTRSPALSFTDDEYGLFVLPMLCFGLLLGHADLMPRLCACWDYINDEIDCFDQLVEALVAPLVPGRHRHARTYTRHLPYRKLDKVFRAAPDKRPALMARYLDEWYHASRREPGHGMHHDLMFKGYWSFEAAAVAWAFDIDDTTFRDMDFYPRDLADYARSRFPRAGVTTAGLFAMSGEPCPRSGRWSPRADGPLADVHVAQGRPMPMAEWRDASGQFHQHAVRWQWVAA
ncbi:PoNe immunity protein domain-containing protein [Aquincola sp. MAHUQ-54]|uniref:PoNe immunity protein domain-containing protein n=1 Tax=Aquincola agrisoli TaxID=3119538 RepID=A0AAW9QJ07_9BURK